MTAGNDINNLIGIVSPDKLLRAGATVIDLIEGGVTLSELVEAGAETADLVGVFPTNELLSVGVMPYDIYQLGNVDNLKDLIELVDVNRLIGYGIPSIDLLNAGVPVDLFMDAGIDLASLAGLTNNPLVQGATITSNLLSVMGNSSAMLNHFDSVFPQGMDLNVVNLEKFGLEGLDPVSLVCNSNVPLSSCQDLLGNLFDSNNQLQVDMDQQFASCSSSCSSSCNTCADSCLDAHKEAIEKCKVLKAWESPGDDVEKQNTSQCQGASSSCSGSCNNSISSCDLNVNQLQKTANKNIVQKCMDIIPKPPQLPKKPNLLDYNKIKRP